MKSLNINDKLADNLRAAIPSGSVMLLMPTDDVVFSSTGPSIDYADSELYNQSLGVATIESNLYGDTVRYDIRSWLTKGVIEYSNYKSFVPLTLGMTNLDEDDILDTGLLVGDTVLCMFAQRSLAFSEKPRVINFTISEGLEVVGLNFSFSSTSTSKLEYLNREGIWVKVVDLDVNGTKLYEFEAVEATTWKLTLVPNSNRSESRLYRFNPVINVVTEDRIAETKIKSVMLASSLTKSDYTASKDIIALHASASSLEDDTGDVLFKSDVFNYSVNPFLVKFEVTLKGLGDGKI